MDKRWSKAATLMLFTVAVAFLVLIRTEQRVPRPEATRGKKQRAGSEATRGNAAGGKKQRAIGSSRLEFASFEPAPLTLRQDTRSIAGCKPGGQPLPSVVHQIWLGGWKPMYAKLLSVMSVHFLLQPERHVLLYDVRPTSSKGEVWPEWQCACLLAECVQTTVPTTIGTHRFDDDPRVEKAYNTERYASDTLGRCANSQLDMLRLEVLQQHGGLVLDIDVFVLRSLDLWRHCAVDAVVGWGEQLHRQGGQVSSGVLMGRPRAQYFNQWRRRLARSYQPGHSDFGRRCNTSTELAAARPHLVHTAPELGPLPRYASQAVYDEHLAQAPIAHLSAFRHAWRLHDIMVHRHLEYITTVVLAAANQSLARGGRPQKKAQQLQECIRTISGACWAKPGKRCGIYGA